MATKATMVYQAQGELEGLMGEEAGKPVLPALLRTQEEEQVLVLAVGLVATGDRVGSMGQTLSLILLSAGRRGMQTKHMEAQTTVQVLVKCTGPLR